MTDSYTKPYQTRDGTRIAGSAAREARIKDKGGVDHIANKNYMRAYVDGYQACKEDTAERVDRLEARMTELERGRNRA
jgi:hypothetical protein